MVGTKKYDFQNIADVLRRLGGEDCTAKAHYREFIIQGIVSGDFREFNDIIRNGSNEKVNRNDHTCWVIGDAEFVKSSILHNETRRLQIATHQKEGVKIEEIIKSVARQMNIETDEMLKRGRENNRSIGRKIVAAIAHRTYGIPIAEIARFFRIGSSSISRMIDQGELYVKERNIDLKH